MKKQLLFILCALTLFSCSGTKFKKGSPLTYEDCGIVYNGETILLLSKINQYQLNLDDSKELYSYTLYDTLTKGLQKNFEGLIIQWFEEDEKPRNILVLETEDNKFKTPRKIKVGSTINEVIKKYGNAEIYNGELKYWYGSVELETQMGIIFSIENNKVSKIHIQSYD